MRSWERGRQQAWQGSWVRLPERQFPAASEVGRWAWERLRCGEWDVSPGPNGGVFAIPKTLDKCGLIVNPVPMNREMQENPEKFSLPSVERLALLAQVAQQGSSFFLPSFYGRARYLRPVWEVLGLPGGGGMRNCVCAILTSVTVFGRCASLRPSGAPSVFQMVREEFCLAGVCLLVGSIVQLCAKKSWGV